MSIRFGWRGILVGVMVLLLAGVGTAGGLGDFGPVPNAIDRTTAVVNSSDAAIGQTTPWRTLQHDHRRTGASQTVGPERNPAVKWRLRFPEVLSSPVVVNGTVFVGIADSHVPGNSGRTFVAVDALSGTIEWSFKGGADVEGAPAVADGKVYFGDLDGHVYGIDTATGEVKWTFESAGPVTGGIAAVNGTVYVGGGDRLYALDTETGNERWNYSVGGSSLSAPAINGGRVYVGSMRSDTVYAIGRHTGELEWAFETGGGISAAPTVVDGMVYVGSNDEHVYALNATDGSEQWRSQANSFIIGSPAVVDGRLFVGDYSDQLYAFEASTGDELWQVELDGNIRSAPGVANDTLYVTDGSGRINSIDPADGDREWTVNTDGEFVMASSPAVVDGMLFVGTGNLGGNASLYAIAESPVATFTASRRNLSVGSSVTLDASSSRSRFGNIVDYAWDVDDDGEFSETGETVTHRFTQPGGYLVGLRVTDSRGISATIRQRLSVTAADESFSDRYPQPNADTSNSGHLADSEGPAPPVRQRWRVRPIVSDPTVWIEFGLVGLSTPLVDGGRVFASGRDGSLVALSAGTGETRWRYEGDDRLTSSGSLGADVLYAGNRKGELVAIGTATGVSQWRVTVKGTITAPPTVAGDTVFVGTTKGSVHAIDVDGDRQRWSASVPTRVANPPAVGRDRVFVTTSPGGGLRIGTPAEPPTLSAFGRENGSLLWQVETRMGTPSTPVYTGDSVAYATQDGRLVLRNATDGTVRWNATVDGHVADAPAVGDERVYLMSFSSRDRGGERIVRTVYAYSLDDGHRLWNVSVQGISSPTITGSSLYVGSANGSLVAIEPETGRIRWTASVSEFPLSTPAVANGMIYVSDRTGEVYAVDRIDVYEPDIDIAEVSVNQASITVDGVGVVPVTLENAGRVAGEKVLNLTVDGEVVSTRTVSVPLNGSTTIRLRHRFDSVGTFDIAVNGRTAGSITVDAAETPTSTVTSPVLDDVGGPIPNLPGFGVPVAVVAIVVVVVTALRRNRN